MINFEHCGVIFLNAKPELLQHIYKDPDGKKRLRFERRINVSAWFWDFAITNDLHRLCFVKSILQYFMQGYWRRSQKNAACRIKIDKFLYDQTGDAVLTFTARQKNNEQFLQICFQKGNQTCEIYLDGQEVLLLDLAFGKAISLLSPSINY